MGVMVSMGHAALRSGRVDEISVDNIDDTHFFTLSQVYEDLLLKMGEKNSDGGQFFTPREVIRAMVHTVDPQLGKTIYDPCCGTGGFPSYARLLPLRGKAEADSRYSWTIDFAARRAKAREEMQPILAQAAETKAEVIDLKEKLKRLKKLKSSDAEVAALIGEINEKEKAARELEAQAAAIDAAVFDLKAVNPSTVAKFDDRSPAEIIQSIHDQGRIVAEALARLAALVENDEASLPMVGVARP
jgi:hypothetical protein